MVPERKQAKQIYLSKLDDAEEIIDEELSRDTDENYIDPNRIRTVANSVKRRLQDLGQLVREYSNNRIRNEANITEDDVEKDIAEDYSPKILF